MLHYSLDWVSFSFQTFKNNFALNLPCYIHLEILGIKLYLWNNLSNQTVWHMCTLVVLFWYISVNASQTSKDHNLWVISTYVSSCEISLSNVGTIAISYTSPYFHIYTLDQIPVREVLGVLFFCLIPKYHCNVAKRFWNFYHCSGGRYLHVILYCEFPINGWSHSRNQKINFDTEATLINTASQSKQTRRSYDDKSSYST